MRGGGWGWGHRGLPYHFITFYPPAVNDKAVAVRTSHTSAPQNPKLPPGCGQSIRYPYSRTDLHLSRHCYTRFPKQPRLPCHTATLATRGLQQMSPPGSGVGEAASHIYCPLLCGCLGGSRQAAGGESIRIPEDMGAHTACPLPVFVPPPMQII